MLVIMVMIMITIIIMIMIIITIIIIIIIMITIILKIMKMITQIIGTKLIIIIKYKPLYPYLKILSCQRKKEFEGEP